MVLCKQKTYCAEASDLQVYDVAPRLDKKRLGLEKAFFSPFLIIYFHKRK